jgi:hypothetical protein
MNGDLSDIEDIGLADADENLIDELPVNHNITRIGQDVMTHREHVEDQDFTEYNEIAEEIRIESEDDDGTDVGENENVSSESDPDVPSTINIYSWKKKEKE